jgi:hypothetical protein
MNKWAWNGKPWQAFKTFAIIFSFTVNLILLLVLLIAAPLILPIVNDIVKPLVGGLNQSFVDMGDATIVRTINVSDEIPISFTLPLSETTVVRLVQPVRLDNIPARFLLPSGGGSINGTVSLELPVGLPLPVSLNLSVPVDQRIPVNLAVDVNIPIEETELAAPFSLLQALFGPLDRLLSGLPSSNEDLFDRVQGSLSPPPPAPNAAQARQE